MIRDEVGGFPLPPLLDERADPLHHLFAVERLDEVVIGTDLEPGQPVLDVALARDEHDGDVRGPLHALDRLADLPARLLRHDDVEQHDVRKILLHHAQRFFAIFGRDDLASQRTDESAKELDYVGIIVGDEDRRVTWHTWTNDAESRPCMRGPASSVVASSVG